MRDPINYGGIWQQQIPTFFQILLFRLKTAKPHAVCSLRTIIVLLVHSVKHAKLGSMMLAQHYTVIVFSRIENIILTSSLAVLQMLPGDIGETRALWMSN